MTGMVDGEAESDVAGEEDARAAFIAGDVKIEAAKPVAAKAAPVEADEEVEAEPDDEDDDLEDEEVEAAAEPDDDADLEDEEPEVADPEVQKRLKQVRRTDRRLREQRDRQHAERDQQFEARLAEIKPKLEAADRFEALRARVRYEPEVVLAELGLTEEDFEHVGRRVYAMTKAGKADPKVREAVDRLTKERERDDEIRGMKKRLEDSDAAQKRAAQEAEEQTRAEKIVDGFAKAASDRYPLAKHYLEKNPARARFELARVAERIIGETGAMPEGKAVIVAFEKERRQFLRDHGIDPKTRAAAATSTNTEAPKPAAKKPAKAVVVEKPFTKADFIDGKFD